MIRINLIIVVAFVLLLLFSGCTKDNDDNGESHRDDHAYQVTIPASGSLQNPAWAPDGNSLLFTRFRDGYNEEPADLLIYSLQYATLRTLVSDGSGNINLPGSCWNSATQSIVFSSTREPHDEIYTINEDGEPGDEARLTNRVDTVAYEPSFSPDGEWVVFESHLLDVEGNGIIMKYKVDGLEPFQELTAEDDDCRQPNWSPAGDYILYQKYESGQWDIWVMDPDGGNHRKVTGGPGEKTDASFSPSGEWIVYSSDEGDLEYANLFIIPVEGGESSRITHSEGYDGAPSWSPGGFRIAFESCEGDPDGSGGTTIWIIEFIDK